MKLYIFLTGLVIGVAVGGFIMFQIIDHPAPEPGEPEYEVIRIPETCHEYKKAFNAKIGITVEQAGECWEIEASDTYKLTRQSFCFARPRNYYGLSAGYSLTGPTASFTYLRRVYSELWVGGTVSVSENSPAIYINVGTTGL